MNGQGIGYSGAHRRVTAQRGHANTHRCSDCGQPARHWSYDHTDPDEQRTQNGWPYSVDPWHYSPRCASCHKRFDLKRKQLPTERSRIAIRRCRVWPADHSRSYPTAMRCHVWRRSHRENAKRTAYRCPGCAHMCKVLACFPGCGSPWAASTSTASTEQSSCANDVPSLSWSNGTMKAGR